MTTAEAQAFLQNYTHSEAAEFRQLAQSGSARINWFAKAAGQAYIITYNQNIPENEAFFYYSGIFAAENLNTPKILAIDGNRQLYIQEFLGSRTLSEIIAEEGETPRTKNLVKKSLEHLFTLQRETAGKIDYRKTFEFERYDALPVLHDLYYFKNFMVDVLELPYHKSSLLKEFNQITQHVERLQPKVLMLRDFQSRNIIIDDADNVFFIDYQSAMEGPAMYDVVSFLHQAKANFSPEFKREMEDYYIFFYPEPDRGMLRHSAEYLRLMRYLQVLGAYGFRGLIQRKAHFISSIPQGITNLESWCGTWEEMRRYPEIMALSQKLASQDTNAKIQQLTAKNS